MDAEDIRSKAIAAHHDGRLQEAEGLYRHLLTLQEDGAIAANLGAVLRELKQYQTARRFYLWAIQTCSYHPTLVLNASNCFQELGDLKESKAVLDLGISKEPNNINIREGLAKLHIARNEPEIAIQVLEKFKEESTKPRDYWKTVGHAWYLLKHKDQAIDAYRKSLEQDETDVSSAAQIIILLKEKGDLTGAIKV